MTKGRRRPNANERLPAMSKIELLLSRLVDDERQVYLAIQQQAMHRTMDGGLGWCLRWEMIEEHNLWLDQKVAIAAQSHVDDTYLPTNKQRGPTIICYQPPTTVCNSIKCCCFVLCVCTRLHSKCIDTWSDQNQFKKEERKNTNGLNLLPPFLNNPLISVAGKQSAMSR